MTNNLIWIFLLILQTLVTSLPIQDRYDLSVIGINQKPRSADPELKNENTSDSANEQVISVRITSSVAVGRGKEKLPYRPTHKYEHENNPSTATELTTGSKTEDGTSALPVDVPPNLIGANIEYIKQLNAKKETKDHNGEPVHPFQVMVHSQQANENESSHNTPSPNIEEYDEDIKDIPTARKVPSTSDANRFHEHKENRGFDSHSDITTPTDIYTQNTINSTTDALLESAAKFGMRMNINNNVNVQNETTAIANQYVNKKELRDINTFMSSSNNYQTDDSLAESSVKSIEFAKTMATVPPATSYIHSLSHRPINTEQNNPGLTTVSFNIVHDAAKTTNNKEPSNTFATSPIAPNEHYYDSSKVYSQPAQIYSEPAKFYSEPAKIYSVPAKIYSEPAKVYSEPAKIYSEPAKFYSEPASLHLNQNIPNVPPSIPPNYSPWQQPQNPPIPTINTTPISAMTNEYQAGHAPMEHQPERNYEIDEKISVLTDGRSHGVQESSTEKCKQDKCKVGYVVEGRQYKKYRVEERTSDGFIVGEYGVVRNEDGALRGVRYTADSDASPRLIHDALMKFLQLK